MDRVLNVWQCLASAELGGGEMVAIQLAVSLNDNNFRNGVLVPGRGVAHAEVLSRGIATESYPLNLCSDSSKPIAFLGNCIALYKLRKIKSDILHFHSPFVYRSVLMALSFSGGQKTIAHVHLEYEAEGLKWAFKCPPDVIVVCAKFLENHVRQCLPKTKQASQKIVVLSNAVDLSKFHPGDRPAAKAELGWDKKVPVVLMVADLAPHKGQKTAIKAVGLLKKSKRKVHCWLVGRARAGSEAYENELRNMVRELGLLEEIVFAGQRSDIPLLMRAADCLVLPSKREGLPLCILEAQASGLPVIASPISGIPEVITDGQTGFLVREDDFAGYANKIITIFDDLNVNCSITSKSILQISNQRSWDKYVANVCDLYSDILRSI